MFQQRAKIVRERRVARELDPAVTNQGFAGRAGQPAQSQQGARQHDVRVLVTGVGQLQQPVVDAHRNGQCRVANAYRDDTLVQPRRQLACRRRLADATVEQRHERLQHVAQRTHQRRYPTCSATMPPARL
ncbi:MAG: hypothetical protein U5K76_08935 [Woeseiaceae bacterium]|nr:hypothetical protein [Woeseiaceae bacterium]